MKLKQILKEIGDSTSKIYKYNESQLPNWSKVDMEYGVAGDNVQFITDSGIKYEVNFECTDNIMRSDFRVIGQPITFQPNKGELYSVMATITDMNLKILKKYPNIVGIEYKPAKTKDNNDGIQRDKLYKIYISKQLQKIGKSVEFSNDSGYTIAMFK